MAIVLEDPRNIGGNIGTSLNRALGSLAQNKLDKMHRNMIIKEDAHQIQNLLRGISYDTAYALAYAKQTDPKIFQDITKAYFLGGGFEGEQNENQEPNNIEALLRQLQDSQSSQGQQQEQQSPLERLNIPQKQSFSDQINQGVLQGAQGNNPPIGNQALLENLMKLISSQQATNTQQQQIPNQPVQQQIAKRGTPTRLEPQEQQQNRPSTFNQRIQKGLQNPDLAIRKENLEVKKEGFKEQKESNQRKAALPFEKQLLSEDKRINEQEVLLNRLKGLEQEGDIDNPQYLKALEAFNFDYPFLKKDGTVEYDKAVAQLFLSTIKGVPGIKNLEIVRGARKGIPDLISNKSARLAVINDSIKNLEAAKLPGLEYQKILDENNGVPPYNIAQLVQKRIGPKLKEIYEKNSEDVTRIIQGKREIAQTFNKPPKASEFPNEELEFPDGSIRKSKKVNGEYKWVKEG